MYDFYFGELDEILANEEKYLLFIKRLLPSWANGIPDAEYLAIYDIIKSIDVKNKKPVLVETGSGASSLAMLYYVIKNNGMLYTWDINGSKGSFLRSVANDTICKSFRGCLHEHWKFIEYPSIDGKSQKKLMEMLWRIQADRWGRVEVLRPGSLEPYSGERRVFRQIGRYSY